MTGSIQLPVAADHPANMSPKQVDQRRMRIGLLVTVLVVHAVNGNPASRAILQIAHAQRGQRMFKPFWAAESPVGQQAVISDRNAHHSEHKMSQDRQH